MKVALAHDYLNQYGGGERVLETLAEIFPEAPIYTLFYNQEKTRNRFQGRVKKTSWLDRSFVVDNHRGFIPLMPLAASSMRAGDDYPVIVSSSAGYSKAIRHHPNAVHISYCHTPLRYAWEFEKYINWNPVLKYLAMPVAWYLRRWDRLAGQRPDILLANSRYIADKIKQCYGRPSEVLYPPVDLKVFYRDKRVKKAGYFLAVGRLLHYKRFDLIIQAFNKLNLPLLIVGDGPESDNLKQLVRSPKIKFRPFAEEPELRTLYNGAEAVIFPQVEDFGLVAAEALACGTPVIAFSQGGAREIVENGITGLFFHHQTVDDLMLAVKKFLLCSFNETAMRKSAQRFSKTRFQKRILQLVAQVNAV
ncbi:MAG: hypothetical protein A3H63_02630 [Candidatus Harrisonbacteria bacterium RIFCSPLOWO2_02_FULL_45_10c]|uniref:Glycosyl transferase family 1 domain-containing protein n=1 Tax=Candidatus Harrisonbacteria bacterium RIFCSPLOWO2_02_FULL_45_10c TaxID=1798410 RepID=A0A1G1ZRU3_9BACT|nr:MAG: hypothetical protein A3H63_02630 [Candidatus Harrisonbacteria bacterium RIFCSPLOWO2_02_FULL_45_10c]